MPPSLVGFVAAHAASIAAAKSVSGWRGVMWVRSPVDAKVPAESRLLDELQHAREVDEILAHAIAERLHLGLGKLQQLVDRAKTIVRREPFLRTGGVRAVGGQSELARIRHIA